MGVRVRAFEQVSSSRALCMLIGGGVFILCASHLPMLGLKWPDGQTSQLPPVVDVPALSCWPAEQVVCVYAMQAAFDV